MGVGLHVKSEPITRGLLRQPIDSDRLLKEVYERLTRVDAPLPFELWEHPGEIHAKYCPAEEAAIFSSDTPGILVISAKTSSAGAGYHMWLCDVLHELARDLGTTWASPDDDYLDETGYLFSKDEDAAYGVMRDFAKALFSHLRSMPEQPSNLRLSMPLDQCFTMEADIHTALGPRTWEWAKSMAIDVREAELWPWPERGWTPRVQLGMAKYLMWMDVRWREPLDDDEGELLETVDELLQGAYEGGAWEIPWREWKEIRGYLQREEPNEAEIATRASESTGPLIGYRRGDAELTIGSWKFRIPGSLALEWTDKGCEGGDATLWFGASAYTREPKEPSLEDGYERLEHPDEGVLCGRSIDDDPEELVISTICQTPDKIFVLTLSGVPERRQEMLRIADSSRLASRT
jgi:hypothetical protein